MIVNIVCAFTIRDNVVRVRYCIPTYDITKELNLQQCFCLIF